MRTMENPMEHHIKNEAETGPQQVLVGIRCKGLFN